MRFRVRYRITTRFKIRVMDIIRVGVRNLVRVRFRIRIKGLGLVLGLGLSL